MSILEQVATMTQSIVEQQDKINDLLRGREVVITSGYNDQSVGVSKRALTGKTRTIKRAWVSDNSDGVVLFLEGHKYALGLDEVQLVDLS